MTFVNIDGHRQTHGKGNKGREIVAKKSMEARKKREAEYLANPTLCLNCNSPILSYKKRINKFCCQSCSATYSNNNLSPEKRASKVEKLKNRMLPKRPKKIFSRINYCFECGKVIKGRC